MNWLRAARSRCPRALGQIFRLETRRFGGVGVLSRVEDQAGDLAAVSLAGEPEPFGHLGRAEVRGLGKIELMLDPGDECLNLLVPFVVALDRLDCHPLYAARQFFQFVDQRLGLLRRAGNDDVDRPDRVVEQILICIAVDA